MQVSVSSILVVCLLGLLPFSQQSNYDGHKVFRLVPQDEQQLELIKNLIQSNPHVDVWQAPTVIGRQVDVQVPKEHTHAAKHDFDKQGIQYNILIHDLNRKILDLFLKNEEAILEAKGMFDNFHSYNDIMKWLMKMSSEKKCGNRCEQFDIGMSYEGRPLTVIKIGTPGENKESIWIDGGIHAREWISPATAMYIIERLIDDYGEDDIVTSLVDLYDWYIIPVLNPDGYHYTWKTDRMWRKTRSTHENETDCVGVDPNRNFDFKWMTTHASADPCSNTFAGYSPMSEPEVQAQADFMLNHNKPWKLFLTLHSYNQLWMSPWGYSKDMPPNFENMMAAVDPAVKALENVHGSQYKAGPASHVLYKSSGTSRDWAAGVLQIPYVYTVELRDTGDNGFLLPPDQILPTGEEIWEALKVMIAAIVRIDQVNGYDQY